MSLPVTTKVCVTCPQCFRPIEITAEQYVDGDGDVYVEPLPIWRAVSIHVRYGCVRRR